MKRILIGCLLVVLCFVIPLGLINSCNRIVASEIKLTDTQTKRMKLEYHTEINGIHWYIFNIDGRDYVGNREGGLTLLEQ